MTEGRNQTQLTVGQQTNRKRVFVLEQDGPNAALPGAYRLTIRSPKTKINPGDMLNLFVTITGYGRMEGAPKLVFTPPTDIIDSGELFEAQASKTGNGQLTAKYVKVLDVRKDGVIALITAAVIKHAQEEDEVRKTYLLDNSGDLKSQGVTPRIFGEDPPGTDAVFKFALRLNDTQTACPPGRHTMQFDFTYCDGEKWNVAHHSFDIEITSWFERHRALLTVLGFIFAAIQVLRFVGISNLADVCDVLAFILGFSDCETMIGRLASLVF